MSEKLQPSHFSLDFAIRPTILSSPAYITSTSDKVQKRPLILLDANENSAGNCLAPCFRLGKLEFSPWPWLNMDVLKRYPSASQAAPKERIARWRHLDSVESIYLGSGASDVLDLIFRATCTPFQDKILVTPPTFDLYKVRARLYDLGLYESPLEYSKGDFRLPVDKICETLAVDQTIKLVVLASPGNPTGSLIPLHKIKRILDFENFHGLVVVDEAYIDFCSSPEGFSALNMLSDYSNLIVVQSLSKSHGLAGLRLGMAFAHPVIISILTKLQMPYSISTPTLTLVARALSPSKMNRVQQIIDEVKTNRQALLAALNADSFHRLGVGRPIGGNEANFIIFPILRRDGEVQRDDARGKAVVGKLKDCYGIGVRYIGHAMNCEGCVRVTVGTAREQKLFLKALEEVLSVV